MKEVGKNGVVSIQVWYLSEEEYSFSEVMNTEEAKKAIAYYEARGCTCEVRVETEESIITERRKPLPTRRNEMNEIKLTLNRLCTINQNKHEIDVKVKWIICDLLKLGVNEDILEELQDKANNAYEAITNFEEACVRALAGGEDDEESN